MIAATITAMMWNQVLTGSRHPHQEFKPRIKRESSQTRAQKLGLRFAKEVVDVPLSVDISPSTEPKLTESEEISAIVENENPLSILVVAPHPDDEILCCATTIADHVAAGDKVTILVITDGDGKENGNAEVSLDYGERRRLETLYATRRLGIPTEDVLFLGFPDGHLLEIENKHRARSSFTQLMSTIRTSLFPGTPYTWGGLKNSLRKVLTDTKPDIVYLPGQHDSHTDHQVAGRATMQAAANISLEPDWKLYAVHSNSSCISSGQVNTNKLELIQAFQSQRHDIEHIKYLEQFAQCRETFR